MKPWEKYSQTEQPSGKPWEKFGAQQAPEEKGFSDRLSEDKERRIQNVEDIQSNPELNPVTKAIATTGQGAGMITDVALEGVKSGYRAIPESIRSPIESGISRGVSAVSNIPVNEYETLGDKAKFFGGTVGSDYATQKEMYPNVVNTAEGAANVAGLVPVAEGFVQGGRLATKGGAKTLGKLNEKTIFPTGDEVKQASRNLFNKAQEIGADYNPKLLEDWHQENMDLLPKGEVAKGLIKSDAADEFINSLEGAYGKRITLDDFESLDRELGNRAHVAFQTDPALARKYSNLQASLREKVSNPNYVEGTDEGIKAHREATRLWSVGTKLNDIQRIVDDAAMYEVPSTAIKTGFRRIAKNDKLMRGYTKEEQKAIRRAAANGGLDGVFKTFGSRLMAIGGGVAGGVPGAFIGYGISEGGRATAEALKKGQAGKISKQLGERSGLIRKEKRITPERLKEILKMKPRDAQKAIEEYNQ